MNGTFSAILARSNLARVLLLIACLAPLLFFPDAPSTSPDVENACVATAPLEAGLGGMFSGLANRARVIQLCLVCMAAALLIIMKKFVEEPSDGAGPRCG